jgi:predicted ATPase
MQDVVLSRAQGNPFFIEELIRSLVDSGAVYRDGAGWRTQPDISVTGIPDSIQSVILGRVDCLDEEAQHVLQTAAVIGHLFQPSVLQRAAGQTANIESVLGDLTDRALVYQERVYPEVEYSFKHVLTQQAVYQTMLSTRRAELHWLVAGAFETLYQDSLSDYCEQLAHHCEQSGQAEKAVAYLLEAGEKAKRHYANASAIAHLTHALELLQTLPDSSERAARELEMLTALGGPLTASQGYTSEDVERTYSRARELALRLGDTTRQGVALHGLWRVHSNRLHSADALRLAQELMDLAQATHEPGLLVEAHRALASTLHTLGDFTASLDQAEQGLALYTSGDYRGHSFL